MIDELIYKFINSKNESQPKTKLKKDAITIFYQSQMHNNYKLDERVIREIVTTNTKCNADNQEVKLIIYYKNKKSQNLIMKNNLTSNPSPLCQTI